jgi:hypothetical protein
MRADGCPHRNYADPTRGADLQQESSRKPMTEYP